MVKHLFRRFRPSKYPLLLSSCSNLLPVFLLGFESFSYQFARGCIDFGFESLVIYALSISSSTSLFAFNLYYYSSLLLASICYFHAQAQRRPWLGGLLQTPACPWVLCSLEEKTHPPHLPGSPSLLECRFQEGSLWGHLLDSHQLPDHRQRRPQAYHWGKAQRTPPIPCP